MRADSSLINNIWFRILQHLTFWVLSFYVFLNLFKIGNKPEWIDYVYTGLFHATILPAVYLNLIWLLPTLGSFNNKYRWYWHLLAVTVMIFLFAWINYSFFAKWSNAVLPNYFFISYYSWWQIVLFFVVYISITSLLKLSKTWFTVNELHRTLLNSEKEKVQIELKALKAQINPHFFFNTLNSIYSMALDKDDRLPRTVLQLSDLMRYFLYESKEDFVQLQKELQILNDYINLQKIRSNEKLEVENIVEGIVQQQKIAPLLLIAFIENAFKHGVKGSTGQCYIRLYLHVKENILNFHLENNKGVVDDVEKNEYKGVGLENVKRRLDLIYPGKHELMIQETEDRFFVQLQLNL